MHLMGWFNTSTVSHSPPFPHPPPFLQQSNNTMLSIFFDLHMPHCKLKSELLTVVHFLILLPYAHFCYFHVRPPSSLCTTYFPARIQDFQSSILSNSLHSQFFYFPSTTVISFESLFLLGFRCFGLGINVQQISLHGLFILACPFF